MTVPVLTGLAGAAWEARVVEAVEQPGSNLRVVRRCVDLADLLSAAAGGLARAALLSPALRRLDRDALARLAASGVLPIGLTDADDLAGVERLRALGVRHVLSAETPSEALTAAVTQALRDGLPTASHAQFMYADPASSLPLSSPEAPLQVEAAESPAPRPVGRLIAVWGPAGAPGRSAVAMGVAAELAGRGASTLLADADVYGGVLAQSLGLLEEPPGLAAAARLAATGMLDVEAIDRLTPSLSECLRLLPGISRAERWPELRPAALEPVWAACRELAEITVVDCGFSLEQDEELSFDVAAPRRNGATLVTLECADVVLAVGAADPIGVQRLVRGLNQLAVAVPTASVRVVLNKVRRGPVGAAPEKQLAAAMKQYSQVSDISFVPYDLAAFDSALLAGRTLAEVAPRSPARQAFAVLAESLAGRPPRARRWRRAAA